MAAPKNLILRRRPIFAAPQKLLGVSPNGSRYLVGASGNSYFPSWHREKTRDIKFVRELEAKKYVSVEVRAGLPDAGVAVVALYMVLERFRNADPVPVYRRFKERGRMAPIGLNYVSSWVTEDLSTCYQVMETADRALLEEWMSHWSDLTDFEVHPVITSKEAADRVEA